VKREYLRRVGETVISVCKILYQKGMLAGSDGNVSVRTGKNEVLATISGVHKGLLRQEDLVVVDFEGQVLAGDGRPSSELAMHLEIYRRDMSINAVVHTHAPWTMALSLAGRGYDTSLLAESNILLGEVVEVPYYPPGTVELARAVASALGKGPALVLDNHGAVTVGSSLDEAFRFMECLEHNARIIALSYMLTRE
jgi:L-fuculose-phosphate aldolase